MRRAANNGSFLFLREIYNAYYERQLDCFSYFLTKGEDNEHRSA